MAFRERMAWLTLVTLVIAYGVYFLLAGPAAGFGKENLVDVIWSFGPVAALHGISMIIGAAALAMSTPKDAGRGPDERERAISRRSFKAGYFVMLVGMILVGLVMPFSSEPYRIFNAALGVVVIAEAVRYAIVIAGYRLGWHG